MKLKLKDASLSLVCVGVRGGVVTLGMRGILYTSRKGRDPAKQRNSASMRKGSLEVR